MWGSEVLLVGSAAIVAAIGFLVGAELEPQAENEIPFARHNDVSFVVLPDTQSYSKSTPSVFRNQVTWIKKNTCAHRILFVSHVGDLVKDDVAEQWSVASSCMNELDGHVPYGISPGNWDMDAETGVAMYFQRYFPSSKFESESWYGGNFQDNRNSFQLIDAGQRKLLWLHLECNAPDSVLDWANTVLKSNQQRIVFVTTHMFLGPVEQPTTRDSANQAPQGVMRWKKCHGVHGNTPEQIWQKCLSRHENVRLIFCGDQSKVQAAQMTLVGDKGNEVRALLSDYRDGYLRLIRLDADAGKIRVWTYSPLLEQLCPGTSLAPNRSSHQFELELGF